MILLARYRGPSLQEEGELRWRDQLNFHAPHFDCSLTPSLSLSLSSHSLAPASLLASRPAGWLAGSLVDVPLRDVFLRPSFGRSVLLKPRPNPPAKPEGHRRHAKDAAQPGASSFAIHCTLLSFGTASVRISWQEASRPPVTLSPSDSQSMSDDHSWKVSCKTSLSARNGISLSLTLPLPHN